jgi:hypothetical protein
VVNDTIWYVWLAAVLISFAVIQYLRLRKHGVRGTFSYTVMWRILFTDHQMILAGEAPRKPRVFVYFVVAAPLVWLVVHFLLGGRLG